MRRIFSAPSRWPLAALALLCLGEGALGLRNVLPPPAAEGPVFHLPEDFEGDVARVEIPSVVESYRADRGSQWELDLEGDVSLTVFSFEWDHLELGPLMDVTSHAPEICNVAAGFEFRGSRQTRVWQGPAGVDLEFDTTVFAARGGQLVYVFKTGWMREIGTLTFQRGTERLARIRGAFVRKAGPGRVLQGGVFGAADEETAWSIFSETILSRLTWTDTATADPPPSSP